MAAGAVPQRGISRGARPEQLIRELRTIKDPIDPDRGRNVHTPLA
jgi:hypothetical protein